MQRRLGTRAWIGGPHEQSVEKVPNCLWTGVFIGKAAVRRLLEHRLAKINEKMKGLKRVQATLGQGLKPCQRSTGECKVRKGIRPEGKHRS